MEEKKSYEFISSIEALVPTVSAGWRIMTTLGIVCLLIALVGELLVNNTFALVFVIPLLYLIHLRRQMRGRKRPVDIRTRVTLFADRIEVIYYGSLITRKGVLTQQYSIPRHGVRELEQQPEENTLAVVFDGDLHIFDTGGNLLQARRVKGVPLDLRLPAEAYGEVLAVLKDGAAGFGCGR